ncbi:MAG: PQQ-binding-like beta-propeller repeat protein [candidate division WOR-3 bacterium]|uniref:PKD domain-containing protein n=1 Tax=candidate division WOR-3 bacterium TaxID=2052148 RepID=A0A7C3IBS5_UNCW3|nr:PQQ-binding-like beta-propeller repeat protein [candidate division WOR-3 bacterium]
MHTRSGMLMLIIAGLLIFTGCPKPPLQPETPRGSEIVFQNTVYSCTTVTSDPAGLKVAYQFDWGDGVRSEWSSWVEGGTPYADTHTYVQSGEVSIMVRAKNTKGKISSWSEPLVVNVSPGEGNVLWKFGYYDSEEPEDSADFTNHTFAIGPEGQIYIGSGDICALLCRKANGARRWEFIDPEEEEFSSAPAIAEDGTIYAGTEGGKFYALAPSGTTKWEIDFRSAILTPPAIGTDGTVYIQPEDDTVYAVDPANGARKWTFYAGGGVRSPVVGADGTVYISQDDTLFALDPANGSIKWRYGMRQAIAVSPAVDVSRNVLYVVDEDGWLASVNLADGSENWQVWISGDATAPVIDETGRVYITGGGRLYAINPANGAIEWDWVAPVSEEMTMPAVSSEGVIYFLVFSSAVTGATDTLYAVNRDGSRRWAVGLASGTPLDFVSAPKIDSQGLVYIGNGTRAWCVVGKGGPAASSWPMFQSDIRNSGRAR